MTTDEMRQLADAPLYGDLANLAEQLQSALVEAAGEIERLTAHRDALREALDSLKVASYPAFPGTVCIPQVEWDAALNAAGGG